jgi:hypothetical protein
MLSNSLNVRERIHNKAFPEKCQLWVKMRNTRCEQMFSAFPPIPDIAQ